MSIFHLNQKTGVVGRCRAEKGNCPFGAEDHFSTIADARVAYEASMAGETFSATLTLRDHTRNARQSSDPKELLAAVEVGSENTLKTLANNPEATREALLAAADKTAVPETREKLLRHNNYPPDSMSAEEFSQVFKEANWLKQHNMLMGDFVSDEHLDKIGSTDPAILSAALENPNNKLSQEKVVALGESGPRGMELAIKSGRYPLAERIDELSNYNLLAVAVRDTDDPAAISKIIAKTNDETMLLRAARNKHADVRNLKDIVERASKSSLVLMAAYRHPAANQEVKDMAKASAPSVASYEKVVKLNESLNGGLREALGQKNSELGVFSSREAEIRFDPEKVKALGLNSTDIDSLVRWHQGNHLFGTKYNETTGLYRGYTD